MKDNEIITFSKFEEMIDFFKIQKDTDEWCRCNINEISLKELEYNPISLRLNPEEYKKEKGISDMTASNDLIEETMSSTNLILRYPNEKYRNSLVRYTAASSLYSRANLSGRFFTKATPADKAEVLNKAFAYWKSTCLILIRDEKISAVHSGDAYDYSILPVYDLLKTLKDSFEKDMGKYTFSNGTYSHERVTATYIFDEKKNVLLQPYKECLNRYNIDIDDSWTPAVRFTTCDVATSGANIYPIMTRSDGKTLYLGEALTVAHKNKTSISNFAQNCASIFSMFSASINKMETLMQIKITHPIGCFKAIAKKNNLPKKLALKACEIFELSMPSSITAHDIYFALWEISYLATNDTDNTAQKLLNIEESIFRTLSINWPDFDEEFEWL